MKKVANNGRNQQQNSGPSTIRALVVLGSLVLQLATCTVVFGVLGYLLAGKWHYPFLTIVGILLGLIVGMSGFAYLAKHFLGEKP
ncbi:AtpZ/AtpI family protein [Alicyclobacillus contaminans]|uniref:AtpZ/AtpI family protein n=1 Tax=Alicyclobacillus contaminans TaxID=392016 RepID=UPI00040B8477|nr:AtpZ/AtpI family protein [Alicyclobacillus contaminans]